jgi:hypothetical protein
VTVRATARGTNVVLKHAATPAAATNKLFHAAIFELPEPGWWDVEVAVDGSRGPARVQFGIEADEAPPRWLELWPWYSWPTLAVALFGMHRVLARRRRPLCPEEPPGDAAVGNCSCEPAAELPLARP